MHTDDNISLSSSKNEIYFRKNVVEKSKTHVLCSIIVFPRKPWRLWNNLEKYGRTGQATDDNRIRHTHFACWINKVTETHSEYVIVNCFSTSTMLARMRLNIENIRTCLPVLLIRTSTNYQERHKLQSWRIVYKHATTPVSTHSAILFTVYRLICLGTPVDKQVLRVSQTERCHESCKKRCSCSGNFEGFKSCFFSLNVLPWKYPLVAIRDLHDKGYALWKQTFQTSDVTMCSCCQQSR